MSESLILLICVGSIAGLIAGALPGIGMLTIMAISYPFLMSYDMLSIIFFYAAALSMSEFIGSVVAINLGIPGNIGSYPAVTEGHKLRKLNLNHVGIAYTALGSIVGGLFSLVFFYSIFYILKFDITVIFKTSVSIAILCFVLITISLFCKNSKKVNAILLMSGWLLGYIGWSQTFNKEILTFGYVELFQGIPFLAFLMGITVIPEILFELKSSTIPKKIQKSKIKIRVFFRKYFGSSLRGSIVGFFAGFSPGLAVELGSFISYLTEQKVRKRKKEQSNLSALISSESGNNAGVFSAMLPVILLGIPITGSEIILVSILNNSGVFFNYETAIKILSMVPIIFISINILGFICAWPLAKTLNYVYKIPKFLLIFLLISLCIWAIITVSLHQVFFDLSIFLLCLIIGILLKYKKIDSLPIVMGLLLQNNFDSSLIRFFALYF